MVNWKLIPGISSTNLSHGRIAVKDAEKTAKMLSSIWDIGTPEVFDYAPKKSENVFRRTVQSPTGFLLKFRSFPD